MLRKLFGIEGNFTCWMEKLADLILLSGLWLLCSLPMVTFATSTSALYYAVVKNVRKERGTAVHEFLQFFKGNWRQGIGVSLCHLLLGAAVAANIRAVSLMVPSGLVYGFYQVESLCLGVWYVFLNIYLFPVFSRFEYGTFACVKASILMSLRHVFSSIVLAAVLALFVWLALRFFILILILPGAWMLLMSLRMEKIFTKYMRKPEEGEEIPWYWEK